MGITREIDGIEIELRGPLKYFFDGLKWPRRRRVCSIESILREAAAVGREGGTCAGALPFRRLSAASRSFVQSTAELSGTARPARALASAKRVIVPSATTRSGL